MPAESKAQQEKMAICEHEPSKAQGPCPSKRVAHEFAATKTKHLPERVTPKAQEPKPYKKVPG